MTTLSAPQPVPEAIVRKLRALVLRWRIMVAARGALATLATAVVALLVVMAVDRWVVLFSTWSRWLLAGGALAAVALAAAWFLARPLATSLTLTGVARALETRHPELQERISSTIELLSSPDRPEYRGSAALIAALADEAVGDARSLRPGREVRVREAWPCLLAAGSVMVVLVALSAAWPRQTGLLLRRAFLANVSRVSHTALHMTDLSAPDLLAWGRDGIDYVMPAGHCLHVELEVDEPAVTCAELLSGPLDGEGEQAAEMAPLPPRDGRRRFACTCPPAEAGFRFRLHAGDALSRYWSVRVVPAPAVEQIDVRYDLPAYTRRRPHTVRRCDGTVAAVAGTRALITARSNKPLRSAELLLDGNAVPAEMTQDLSGAWLCTFPVRLTAGMDGRWSLRLRDEYGFGNAPTEYAIRALADEPPRVDVLVPGERQLRLRGDDRLPIAFRLRDDFALSAAELNVEVDAQAQPAQAVPLDPNAAAAGLVAGATLLDLGKLPTAAARVVAFRLRALDNLPAGPGGGGGGPQEGFSERFTIQLDAKALSFADQVLLAEELRVREALKKVLAELKEAKKDSSPLRHAAAKAARLAPPVVQRIDAMRQRLATADGVLRELAATMPAGAYAGMARKVAALADDHVAKAHDLAGQVKSSDAPKQRAGLADEADFQVDRAIAVTNDLLKELGEVTSQLRKAMRLDDLAGRQGDLTAELARLKGQDANAAAGTPGEAGARPQPMSEEEWRRQQGEVASQLGDLAKQTPGALSAQLARDAQRARDLLSEARLLARLQAALAGDSARIGAAPKADPNTLARRELPRLTKEQADLAGLAEKLADELKKGAPQADRLDTAAARDARGAAERLGKAEAREAAAAAEQAARKLREIAGRLGADVDREALRAAGELSEKPTSRPAASQPASRPADQAVRAAGQTAQEPRQVPTAGGLVDKEKLTRAAAELARRQQALARQLKALAEGDATGLAAARQGEVTERTGELARGVRLISDQADELIGEAPARQQAAQADKHLQQAGKEQQQAATALAARRAPQATPAQQAAARSLAAAATALERLGQLLAAAAKSRPGAEDAPEGQDMAEAYDSASKAAQNEQLSDAARAAQQLRDLARAAADQAQAMGGQMAPAAQAGMDDMNGMTGLPALDPRRGAGEMEASMAPAELEALGLGRLDWARLHGELRDRVLQAAAADGPAEYRELILRYFREVARRGAAEEKK